MGFGVLADDVTGGFGFAVVVVVGGFVVMGLGRPLVSIAINPNPRRLIVYLLLRLTFN